MVRTGFSPADWVTAMRALLVVILAAMLARRNLPNALPLAGIAASAAALDGVDGWVARRSGTASAFGARFDMETDALLVLVLAALVWRYDKAGVWVIASGLLRYVFVAAALRWPWMSRPLEPSRRRQTVCVVQIAALIAALLPAVGRPSSGVLAAAALAALTWSFLVDILWLWRWQASRPLC